MTSRLRQQEPAAGRAHLVLLLAILAAAFALRLAFRLRLGPDDFWRDGYGFFYGMARSVASGHGLYMQGEGWAARAPIYPLFLALAVLGGGDYLLIVVPQALMGTLTVFCGYLIGRRLFGARAGLIAAAMAAIYPYYVAHDTALQDTCMADAGAAVALWLLLRARASRSTPAWCAAGAALGLSVLIRPTLLPFAAGAVAWMGLFSEGTARRRLARAAAVGGACALAISPWLARNALVVGRPVMTSEVGVNFWIAHNADTFSAYPDRSIDRSAAHAYRSLGQAKLSELRSMGEVARSDWFLARGLAYVRDHPWETVVGAVRKEIAGFSVVLNPRRGGAVEALYFASYAPVLVLGLIGMALAWRGWREQGLVYLQFLGFMAVTAIYWAHTSHRVYLDVYLMAYAASVLDKLTVRAAGRGRAGAGRRPPAAAGAAPQASGS